MLSIRTRRRAAESLAPLALAPLLALGLAGCATEPSVPGGPGSPEAAKPAPTDEVYPIVCVDWVFFRGARDMFQHSDLVITGTPLAETEPSEMFHLPMDVWEVQVDAVHRGDLDGAATVDVGLVPQTCGEDGAAQELEAGVPVLLFLSPSDEDPGAWRTVTAYQGVKSLPADGSLPWEKAD